MPLPISATTYQHNPLTGVKAEQAGKEIGSPFSNFVEGLFSGAKQGLQIAGAVQELQFAPREQERKDKRLQLDEIQTKAALKREKRLADQAELERDYKERSLDIRERGLDIRQDKNAASIRRMDARSALAAQEQAKSNIVNGAIDNLITNGNPDPLIGILKQDGPILRTPLYDTVVNDKVLGPAVVQRFERAIAEGRVKPQDARRVQDFIQTLGHAKSISTTQELLKFAKPVFARSLGAVPGVGNKVTFRKKNKNDPASNWEFFEFLPDGSKRALGTLPADVDPKQLHALNLSINTQNWDYEMRQGLRKAIEQTAEVRAQEQTADNAQQELPAKISREASRSSTTTNIRTPASRVGLANTPTTTEDEVIRQETSNPNSDEENQAKNRLLRPRQSLGRRDLMDTAIDATKRGLSLMRGS